MQPQKVAFKFLPLLRFKDALYAAAEYGDVLFYTRRSAGVDARAQRRYGRKQKRWRQVVGDFAAVETNRRQSLGVGIKTYLDTQGQTNPMSMCCNASLCVV